MLFSVKKWIQPWLFGPFVSRQKDKKYGPKNGRMTTIGYYKLENKEDQLRIIPVGTAKIYF